MMSGCERCPAPRWSCCSRGVDARPRTSATAASTSVAGSSSFRPTYGRNVCRVEPAPEIELGEDHGAQILVTLPDGFASSLEIVGASPVAAAYSSARDHLLAQAEDMPRTSC